MMPKSDVKSNMSPKQLTRHSVESLSKTVQKGRQINFLRGIQEPAIESYHRRCIHEKGEFPRKFYVCKVLYPPEKIETYPQCDHANDMVPNRDFFTHEEYMQFLATPKKRPTPSCMPKIIIKNIATATVHVNKLALPRNRTLMETFKENCKKFSIFQIESIANKIYHKQFSNPQQAINEMKQNLCDRQKHIRFQKSKIKRLQKKIEKCNEYNFLASTLTKKFRDYMIKEKHINICTEAEKLAIYTHNHLSSMFEKPKCEKNSTEVIDKVLLEFSNKFASCMCNILENKNQQSIEHSAQTPRDNCLDKLRKMCVPIEDHYPDIYIRKSSEKMRNEQTEKDNEKDASAYISSDSNIVRSDDVDNDVDNLHDSTPLDPLLLNITPEQCAELTRKLSKIKHDIDHGTIKATASKKGDKSIPIEDPNGGEVMKIKKKKKPKKKRGKKKNEKCFGKRDIKPQWAIEWRDKNLGETCNK